MLTCESTTAFAVDNLSPPPLSNARYVSLTRVMISFPISVTLRLATRGFTLYRNVCTR